MSSFCWQLNALLRKNLIVMKRNILSTLAELLFPILLMFIVVGVRQAFPIEKTYYSEENKEDFDVNKTLAAVTTIDLYLFQGVQWNGLYLKPILTICRTRPYIALIGSSFPKEIKEEIVRYTALTDSLFADKLQFKTYATIADLEAYVTSDGFDTDKEHPGICFGIFFEEIDKFHFNYSLHYFDSILSTGIKDVPSNRNGPINEFRTVPDMVSYQSYVFNGYLQMMKICSDFILKRAAGTGSLNPLKQPRINFGMMPMKYELVKNDPFGDFLGFLFPFFLIIAYVCPLCIYVFRMVKEKETRSKEGMKIMGMNEGTYFLSYFIQYFVTNTLYAVANSAIVLMLFTHIPFEYIFAIYLLYGLDVFALAYFLQSFVDKTRIAMILSLLVYFLMFFLSIAVFDENVPQAAKIVMTLLPPVGIELGVDVLGNHERSFKYFNSSRVGLYFANYSLSIMYIMLFVDIIIYLFLGFYFQNIISHQFGVKRPFYFLCTKSYWCKGGKRKAKGNALFAVSNKNERNDLQTEKLRILSQGSSSENFQSEAIYANRNEKTDVFKIVNIKKTFDDKKTAVDGVSLNLYKDEIFALLGHNGAGKSTIISMLSGLYEATGGEAYFNGENILGDLEMDRFRRKLGICPQHDVLFNDLTIEEHLHMFCVFKGVPREQIQSEIDKTIKDFHIENIKDQTANKLSGGQRRKLSIAIALIGGSEVIFLDEPSSGMDITSRRNLWNILKSCSGNKIIVLTTHFMEEASVLGNRIGIISDGKMKCVGSPLFLIERYGKFVSLILRKQPDANNEEIIDFIKKRTQNCEFEVLSEEILVRLPRKIAGDPNLNLSPESSRKSFDGKAIGLANGNAIQNECNTQFNLSTFFKDLDENLSKLKIKSYGASMPTLEDVFLNVSSENRAASNKGMSQLDNKNDKILFEENYQAEYTYWQKLRVDMRCILRKRFLQIFRDVKSFILEVFCPILLIIIGLAVCQVKFLTSSDPDAPKLTRISERQSIIFSSLDDSKLSFHSVLKYPEEGTNVQVVPLKNDIPPLNSYDGITNYKSFLYELDQLDCYGAYYLLKQDDIAKQYDFVTYVNTLARQGPMYYTAHIMDRIINHAAGREVKIDFQHRPFPITKVEKDDSSQMINATLVFFIAVSFSLIPANFITVIVKERENNSKHLQKISGISILAYWLSNYIFEIVKYYIVAGVCLLFIYAFDYFPDYLYILYILYGPAMVAFTYLLSFCFDSESAGQNSVIFINFLFGALGSAVCIIFRINKRFASLINLAKGLSFVFRLCPSFGFSYGFSQLLNRSVMFYTDYPEQFLSKSPRDIIKLEYIGADILYLCLESVVYVVILVVIEVSASRYALPPQEKLMTGVDDSQVLKEIERANKEDSTIALNDQNPYSIRIKNLKKNYSKGYGCKPEIIKAVKNLSFCLEYGECFGLLGVNGAGKTTAFKCLTQELRPTNGSIAINGSDIRNQFEKVRHLFGYCPQFDAIFEYMTVYENLEFYAKIKGVRYDYFKTLVTAMISEMSLSEYTNKISGNLSGGNKRKLTVAISLICNPPIVLLDEPSTGMDPEARRFMWAVIHKISTKRKKSSVIMTTHSMEEAETLCRRMGIMVNGEFKCLGSGQMIKEKYGFGYEINLRVMPLEESAVQTQLSNFSIPKDTFITNDNIKQYLEMMRKSNFYQEWNKDSIGRSLLREMDMNGRVTVTSLINWCYYVSQALKVIGKIKEHFDEIILTEFIENNFLFKVKKTEHNTKSIGFLFGLVETIKDEFNITEYSIQQTSLEQIFNQFAAKQGLTEENSNQDIKREIAITQELIQKLIF